MTCFEEVHVLLWQCGMLAYACYSLRLPLSPRSWAIVLHAQEALSLPHTLETVNESAVWFMHEGRNVCVLSLCSVREVPGPLAPVAFY